MKTRILILSLVLVLSLVVAGLALAAGGLKLPRGVQSGGISDAVAGDVALRATLGQPVVGVVSSGEIALGQGFWRGGKLPESGQDIYLPFVQR